MASCFHTKATAIAFIVTLVISCAIPGVNATAAYITLRSQRVSNNPPLTTGWGLSQPRLSNAATFMSKAKTSFMDRLPGEDEKAFFRRITAAASDPAMFEQMVLQNSTDATSNAPVNVTLDKSAMTAAAPKRSGYVRAEDWEAEEQRRRKSGELTWEERVQFEGQQYGNRVQQNDILRKNLLK